jgi:hypothetical protein
VQFTRQLYNSLGNCAISRQLCNSLGNCAIELCTCLTSGDIYNARWTWPAQPSVPPKFHWISFGMALAKCPKSALKCLKCRKMKTLIFENHGTFPPVRCPGSVLHHWFATLWFLKITQPFRCPGSVTATGYATLLSQVFSFVQYWDTWSSLTLVGHWAELQS